MLKEQMPSDSLPLEGLVCLPVILALALEKGFLHQMGSYTRDFQRSLQPEKDSHNSGNCGR